MYQTEYKEQRETDPDLQHFSRHIDKITYPEWKGWRHLRGEIKKENQQAEN